uniref:CSON002270 protein n=3 Tax=Culicoides sonorensis TaxID=179676 RepID=A0A336LRS2_CULSO
MQNLLKSIKILLVIILWKDVRAYKSDHFSCPVSSTYFQKIISYRPSSFSLSITNLLYKGLRSNLPSAAINANCWKICKQDINCFSYILFFNTSECYGFSKSFQINKYEFLKSEYLLIPDENAIYFEKLCLPEISTKTIWPIIRLPGRIFIGRIHKNITQLVNRTQCIEYCLKEMEFHCQSVLFISSSVKNRNGLRFTSSRELGQCILNQDNMSSRSRTLRKVFSSYEYIEIDCFNQDRFCSFERHENMYFPYADLHFDNISAEACEKKCLSTNIFTCLGYSFINNVCLIHSEKAYLNDGGLNNSMLDAYYMERIKCLNVSVTCSTGEMIISYNPEESFNGKIFVSDNEFNPLCKTSGLINGSSILVLPIGNEMKESLCGISRAYHVTKYGKRTLLQTKINIQNDEDVSLKFNKVIKVGCIINQYNAKKLSRTNIGSNITTTLPSVSLKFIDTISMKDVNNVSLGDKILLRVNMFNADGYDIQSNNLYVTSLDGKQKIQLLDDNGCPTYPILFPHLRKIITYQNITLQTNLTAFKFIHSPIFNIDIRLTICKHKCRNFMCYNETNNNRSKKKLNEKYSENNLKLELQTNYGLEETKLNKLEINEEYVIESKLDNTVALENYQQQIFTQYTLHSEYPQHEMYLLTEEFSNNVEINLHFQMFVTNSVTHKQSIDSFKINDTTIFIVLPESDTNIISFDASFYTVLIMFWLSVNGLIMFFCYWFVKCYKRNMPESYYNARNPT